MNVFVRQTNRCIQPFDDPIGDVLIQNRPLSDWQAEACKSAGLTIIPSRAAPCLVMPDNLFITGEGLRRFAQGAAGRNAVLVLKRSLFGQSTTSAQLGIEEIEEGWRFDEIRFDAGTEDPPVDVVVDPEEKVVEVPFPSAFTGQASLKIGLPKVPIATLHHWAHLLWANQFSGSIEIFNTPRHKLAWRLISAIVRAFSINKWKVLGKLNTVGPGCDIHPTAVVEGCTLGKNVTIGAFAHVQFSTLDDGAIILPGAQVGASVIGRDAWVGQACVLRFSVLYPGAIASQAIMQHSILGRDVATTAGSGTIDFSYSGEIKVPLDGKLRSTGARFLGAAFGHRSRIGAGILLGAGRSVPNDYLLVGDPRQILTQIPAGHEGTPLIGSANRARPVHLLRTTAAGLKPDGKSH